ncbi:hypothetical protein C2S51_034108 [Perilla frutescens var. frutescens]|nr:hypothetical protein C2S51_034108 [Perilla frutescens var. frutescens]
MGEREMRKLHAIMICLPYQGHLNPFVNLALKLASKGFTITFVHLEFLHRKLCDAHKNTHVDFFSTARESGLDIRFTTISDPFPLEFDRDLNFYKYWEIMIRDFPPLVDDFVGKIIHSHPDLLHFLVADTIYNWPLAIAQKYKLVNVSLWTQSALVFSLAYHWDLLQQNGHFPSKENVEEEINYVPGVDSISTKDLMVYLKEDENSSIICRGTRIVFENVKDADFVLQNTVEELEPQTLAALNKYKPINYAIGPITFFKNLPTNTVTTSMWSESDCTGWLQSKPPGSVLYVSFGSLVNTSKHVLEEIAYGLALSQVNFVWVIRQGILGDGGENVLPAGFEDEIKDRGLIVGWCNQIELLSNPAVGGFLTHNGWNSTVESVWSGVPMICYPIGFEQPCNRKLVVDDWKMGINLCESTASSLHRKQVANTINSFINGGVAERLRLNGARVKQIMQNAMAIDGSSEINFERFINDLKARIHAQN